MPPPPLHIIYVHSKSREGERKVGKEGGREGGRECVSE